MATATAAQGAGSAGGTIVLPRPGRPPARGPATRPARGAGARRVRHPRARTAHGGLGRLLDRMLRGPAYIAVVGVLLVGIVFFNVDVLQVNHGIARTGVRAEALKRENAVLTRQLAQLRSSERIQMAAAERGLVLPPPGDIRYLRARGDDSRRALRTMTAPGRGPEAEPAPAPVAVPQTPTTTAPVPAATVPTGQTTPAPTVPAQTAPAAGAGTTAPAGQTVPAQPAPGGPPATGPTGGAAGAG